MRQSMSYSRRQMAVVVLLLIWNLIGVGAFVAQFTMDIEALARENPYDAHLFATMPAWAWAVYALGVGAGVAGSLALLFHRRMAGPLFVLSLAAIIA